MNRLTVRILLAFLFCGFLSPLFARAQDKKIADSLDAGVPGTIEGLVRDISCPMQAKDATATKFNMACVRECVKGGSPLILLSKDGSIYIPISDSMPDKDQRERLLPFAGKYVKVTGQIYERQGTRAIAIKDIKEMKDVPLITDAQ